MALTTLTKIGKGITSLFKAKGATHARELSERFSDVINVKDYGAIGDGVNDDTQSITNALSTRKAIFFPAGDYKITSLLTFYAGQCIYGINNTSEKSSIRPSQFSIITQHTKDIGVFEHMSHSTALGCSFKNLILRTNEQSTAGAGNAAIQIGEWGATSESSNWWKMQSIRCMYDNLFIMGFDVGMSVTGWSWESTYSRCYFFKCSQIGLRIGTGGTGITQLAHCSFVHINSSGGAIGNPISGIGLLVEDAKASLIDTRFEATDGSGLVVRGGEVDCFTPYFESNLGHHIVVDDSPSGIKDTDGISRVRTFGGIWAHGITHYSLLRSNGVGAHDVILTNIKSRSFGANQQAAYGEFHLPNLNTNLQVINYEGNADVLFNSWNGCPTLLTLKGYSGVVFTRKAVGTLADQLVVASNGALPTAVVPHTNTWVDSNGNNKSAQDLLSFAKGSATTRFSENSSSEYIIWNHSLRYYSAGLQNLWVKKTGLLTLGHMNTGGLNGKTFDASELRGVRAPNYTNVAPTVKFDFSPRSLWVGRQFFVKDMTHGTGAIWNVSLQNADGTYSLFVLPTYAYTVFELQKNSSGGSVYWEVVCQVVNPSVS